MKKYLTLFLILYISSITYGAKYNIKRKSIEITIYNKNLALIKDKRIINLKKGINLINWKEVSSLIDSTSVQYFSPYSYILEQNYEYDLINRNVLLNKFIGKDITIIEKNKEGEEINRITGKLLSVENNTISAIKVNNKVILDPRGEIILPSLPEGLLTEPTLSLKILSKKKGYQQAEISYLSQGLTWKADYIVTLNKEDTKLNLNGWVTIENKSGSTYPEAKIKLIAGDIHLIQSSFNTATRYPLKSALSIKKEKLFKESKLFEYHMYTLNHKSTLKNKETKQISFIDAKDIKFKKLYIFDYNNYYSFWWHKNDNKSQKVMIKLEIKNSKKNNLGIALPKGKIRIYKNDNENRMEFLGEDLIDHTPEGEKIRLYVGDAFDITGSRTITQSSVNKYSRIESITIKLNNHKKKDVTIYVIEHFNYNNWDIISSSNKYKKLDAWKIEFKVKVPAKSSKSIKYTYKGWW